MIQDKVLLLSVKNLEVSLDQDNHKNISSFSIIKKRFLNLVTQQQDFLEIKTRTILLKNISFELNANEILGVVGESGSGKSMLGFSIMGLLPKIAKITQGSLYYKEKNLVAYRQQDFRKMRGSKMAMVFQEPMNALNPVLTCGYQVQEVLLEHHYASPKTVRNVVLDLFDKVKLLDPIRVFDSYPHQISGGQKQRVLIAIAIACKPKLLIADEPTTALDVTVQKEIIQLLKDLQKETQMSILFISHDLSLIRQIANRVLVLYNGQIVEQGTVESVFTTPKALYTQALLYARPSFDIRLKKLPTIQDYMDSCDPEGDVIFESKTTDRSRLVNEVLLYTEEHRRKFHDALYRQKPLLEVVDLVKEYESATHFFGKKYRFRALDGVSFKVYEGETLGLVGESGCGKSTLGNVILQLDRATSGQILYRGIDMNRLNNNEIHSIRKEIQIIFQDPFSSLNPRIPVGKAIMEPMQVYGLHRNDKQRRDKAITILEQVGLSATHFDRFPHEFSGGQRQRIGIARAIALEPKLIVCDESVSALDISVQAQVLNLLNDLKTKFGFTYIFISHDLAVIKYMCDQVLVMNKGKIEEKADADVLYANPQKEYTKKLLNAIIR